MSTNPELLSELAALQDRVSRLEEQVGFLWDELSEEADGIRGGRPIRRLRMSRLLARWSTHLQEIRQEFAAILG
jgi:hypothetical protein